MVLVLRKVVGGLMVEFEHYEEVFISFSFSSFFLFLSILFLLSFLLSQSNSGRGREYGVVRNKSFRKNEDHLLFTIHQPCLIKRTDSIK